VKVSGAFSTAFRRAARGDCRVIARYEGDDLRKPSKDKAVFRC
jgi:hypothetical protein